MLLWSQLRIFINLDLYLSFSYHHRTWFSHPKSILIIIVSVISFFTLFNFHLIIFGCFYEPNGLINLVMYNCLPFLFMVIFNSGFIYHLIHLRHIIIIHKSRIRHQAISITLVITTFLFLVMAIPATVAYEFICQYSRRYYSVHIEFNPIHVSHIVISNLYNYICRISTWIYQNDYM